MKYTPGELIGDYVRQRRIEMGMSQVEFSERCGFYQTYLSRLERGQANPSLNALEVLAASFGMSVFELFDAAQKAGPRPSPALLPRRKENAPKGPSRRKG